MKFSRQFLLLWIQILICFMHVLHIHNYRQMIRYKFWLTTAVSHLLKSRLLNLKCITTTTFSCSSFCNASLSGNGASISFQYVSQNLSFDIWPKLFYAYFNNTEFIIVAANIIGYPNTMECGGNRFDGSLTSSNYSFTYDVCSQNIVSTPLCYPGKSNL